MTKISKIKSWILSKICDRLVEQGPNHKGLITQYYKIMAKEARKEFREDNKLSLDSFLRECFEKSLE